MVRIFEWSRLKDDLSLFLWEVDPQNKRILVGGSGG